MPLIKCQKGNIILAKRTIGQTGSHLFILFCCSQWSVVVRIFFMFWILPCNGLNISEPEKRNQRTRRSMATPYINTKKIGTYFRLTISIYFSHRFGHLGLSAWLLLRHLLQIVSQTSQVAWLTISAGDNWGLTRGVLRGMVDSVPIEFN